MKTCTLWVVINLFATAALSAGLAAFEHAAAWLIYTAAVARVFFAAGAVAAFLALLDRWTEGGRA